MNPRRKPDIRILGSGTRKRITLTMPASLYTDLQQIAADQHRDLQQQCIYVLETEVKRAAGRKREADRRAAGRRWEREIEEFIRGEST